MHRSRASEDDADYMADLRNFMVPSFDTPGHSSACSVPDTDEKPMQLGKTGADTGEPDHLPYSQYMAVVRSRFCSEHVDWSF